MIRIAIVSARRLAYLERFQAEPVCFVRRKKRRENKIGRPARKPGNALLSRLL